MNIVRFLTVAAALFTGTAQAQFGGLPFGPGAAAQQAPTFSVSAKASVSSYKAGESFYIALQGDIPQPWHAYFRNPATVGEPMTAELTAPAGFAVEGPYWQAPDRHEGMLGVAYTYNTPTVVWKVTPQADAPQQAEFAVSATAQTCSDTGCNAPETKTAAVSLSAGDGAAAADWAAEESKVEVLGDTPTTVTASQSAEAVVLSFTAEGEVQSAYFFSDDNSINPTAEQPLTKTDSGYCLTLPRNDGKDSMAPVKDEAMVGKELPSLGGILVYDGKHSAVKVSFGPTASPAVTPAPVAEEPTDEEEESDEEEEADEEEIDEEADEEETDEEEADEEEADDSAASTGGFAIGGTNGGGFGAGLFGGEQQSTLSVTGSASVSSYKAGEPFYVALQADIPQPWHAYFRNPATVGEPMTAELTAPEGFAVEGPYWSAPDRHEGMLGVAYTYNTPTIVWKVTPAANAPQQAEITVSATAQTCSDTGCNQPETKTATISLSAGDGAAAADWAAKESKVEVLGDTPTTATMTQTTDSVVLSFTAEGEVKSAYFFSDDNSINPTAEQTLTKTDSGYTLTLTRNDGKDTMAPVKDEALVGKELPSLSGILVYDGKHAALNVSTAAPAPAVAETPAAPAEATATEESSGYPYYLYAALILLLGCTAFLTFSKVGGEKKPYILIPFYVSSAWLLAKYMGMSLAAAPMGLFIAITCLLAGFWTISHWCTSDNSVKGKLIGGLSGLLLISSFVYTAWPRAKESGWQQWSPELMAQTLSEGKPVYVDFTATWCATCQMNKKVAYTEDILRKFADNGVVLMRADKTNPNPYIDTEMRRLGRTQVPVNVLYVPTEATKNMPESVRYAITTELFGPAYLSEFIDKTINDVAMDTPREDMGFWKVIAFLFIGGFILNFMPCVFPVIGLKVMSFVEMGGGSRGKVLLHSMAFVLGILLSFLALSVLLLLCFPAGERSWAVWMQNPWVVYGIVLLLLILGLSMFGLFEIGVGATGAGQSLQNKEGTLGSFFQGIFITIVATPCSAPFLGSAMPLALALPDGQMVLAFCFMGLGLAFPYILLGAFPKLIAFLPRPGAWMETLKKALSFLLFGAAAWILSVYLAMYTGAVQLLILGIILICYACWIYGKWCPMYMSSKTRIFGLIATLIFLAGGATLTIPASTAQEQPQAEQAPGATPAANNADVEEKAGEKETN